jgi:hypothetical protein
VAHGGWPIDLHPPDGIYSPAVPAANPPLPGLYGIPLRALYSRTCANLFLAGRDISVSHVAHGSTRVMKTCAVIGQASGTAAAVAIRRACTPRALASDPRAVHALQQTLLRDGVYLPFVCNDDPRDLTRQPGVRAAASSEATLRLDEDDLANPAGWERAGESAAETPARLPAEVPLARPLAQALVLSEGHLDALRLDVHSSAPADVPVHIYVRQGDHLRDIGPAGASARDIAVLDAIVPPGSTTITVAPPRPLTVDRRCPVIIVLDTAPAVSWRLSSQEPPGTQAAVWDEDLGYWRWLHGTLRVAATPDSVLYGACNVLSGVTRPERGPNLWVSDPAQPLPQQVEVAWPGPVRIGSVEVTFDSQLSGWIWEGAFPLLARDYTVDVREACDGRWVEVAHVSGNHQRRRVHTFAPREARAVRVTVLATNGGRTARIVEVRAYTPTGGEL